MSIEPGTRLGPYQIIAPLGAGGMGEVYRAFDTRLQREVAIKIAHERYSERFDRQALAVASLSHPNIVPIFDVGTEGGMAYAVTELLEGETLGTMLRRELPVCSARRQRNANSRRSTKSRVQKDLPAEPR